MKLGTNRKKLNLMGKKIRVRVEEIGESEAVEREIELERE